MNRHWNKPHFPTSIETIKLLIALTMLFACLLLSSIAQSSTNIDLSDEEKEHLAAKGRVTMCVDPDWMPYERIDEQGKHVGIAADFMSEFQKRIPVPIELVLTESWKESLEAAKSRQCDILSLLNESPQRREFLNFTDPYLTDSVVLVARNDVFYLDGLEALSGRKLGVVDGYVYEEKIRKQYPEIIIIPVKSVGDALRKVSDGKIYATLDALFIITSNIQELGLSNLKIAGQTGLDNAFRVGVRKDDPILLSVFDKLIKNLDDTTRNAILRSWYTLKFQHGTDWRMVWQVTAIAIIILCLLGYITLSTRRFNRKLAKSNEDLHKKNQERLRAEESKMKLEEQIRRSQKMESLGMMASGIAHDLNNILTGIVSYPDLLLLQLPKDSPLREAVETIKDSGQRAADVVSDLLTIAKGVAIVKQVCNLNRIVQEYLGSAEHMRLEQDQPGVVFENDLDAELLNISCSSLHMQKILINLVLNAYEAIGSQGKVTIKTANRYLDEPLRGYEDVQTGEYVLLTVSDTGPGISRDDLEMIFEPFFTKKVMGRSGTGLGLAVVWNTIYDHDGYINVTSNENGTIFELYFPVTRDEVTPEEMKHASFEDYLGKGERILVVDDERKQREIACGMLTQIGYAAEAVSSGEEAIQYLENHAADLIVLDMIMPGMNGRETYERAIKIHPNQKAIIASGYSDTEDVKATQKLGAGKYVRKPYTLEKIGVAVRDELRK
jgi:signal transduction histidine kinase